MNTQKATREQKPLTTGEIARHCHVTYRGVLKWIEAGKLATYKTPGKHNRVRVVDFIDFLNKYNMPVPDNFVGRALKKRILIVDDDKNAVSTIRRILRMRNGKYEIDVAFNGFDAGAKLVAFKPDIVVLDIRMPHVDGYTVIKRIRQSLDGGTIKIIVISGYFQQEGKRKISSMGVDACIDKPFDPERFLQTIEEVLA
ncbi:response regulator [Candidatus Omnitrophota bacterium]